MSRIRSITFVTAMSAVAALAVPAAAQTTPKPAASRHAEVKMAAGAHDMQKGAPAQHETMAQLKAEAKVSAKAARTTALAQVPGGHVKKWELERENGKLLYSFDIASKGKAGIDEVQVDAISGAVLSNTHETPAMEKAEAKADAKEARAGKTWTKGAKAEKKEEMKEEKKEEKKEAKPAKPASRSRDARSGGRASARRFTGCAGLLAVRSVEQLRVLAVAFLLELAGRDEAHRRGVHAVAQARRLRAVVEDVAEVRVARARSGPRCAS